ncbi:hypothetical protein GCM10011391_06890 [Pullulanibacillus camelliae]|uniref:BD-FAE-like domain-containing protein n=1 Tax=Pullulanibacillus camelliae TaxID=1707096 RepID=A0A8J2VL02_9BACL|nr:alpha/beta hydrolase [Pullulanibacillus camelliae]GGE30879.1 hypothetical protein GCM10011391_06890 [Pullulanibacillus camelliae]
MKKVLILIVIILLCYIDPDWASSAKAKRHANERGIHTISKKTNQENKVELLPNIVYAKAGSTFLKMHLLVPKQSTIPHPLIIFIKGGGWGDKHPQRVLRFIPQLVRFAQSGYVVASIEHRTSHMAQFPAQLYDVKAAIRYLKAHADQFNIDAKKVGVWGSSSGGHLAALIGTSGDVPQLEGEEGDLRQSSRVQAVVDWYGPTDFLQMSKFPSKVDFDGPDSPESKLIGGPIQENKDKVKLANPITYITSNDPPFLIMHGDKDMRVPYNQSVLLYTALKKAKVQVAMYKIKGAGHGGFTQPEIMDTVLQFFDNHLKH